MKYLIKNIFPINKLKVFEQFTKLTVKRQSGQTFVEFVLLLSSIVIVAFSFMRVANNQLAERWTTMAQIIVEDDTQQLTPR